MIEFTKEQEMRDMRQECRVWAGLMIEAWYWSNYAHATDYLPDTLVSDLQEVYFRCRHSGVDNNSSISLLGFLVLRAKMLRCSEVDVQSIVEYFLTYAQAGNVNYAQAWVEIYLEEAI